MTGLLNLAVVGTALILVIVTVALTFGPRLVTVLEVFAR